MALRARWAGPIGLADHAPKHAHGGCRPWASELTINAVNATSITNAATAGLNDPRVSVHEPAKWVARLRSVNTSDRPILLRTEMGAGHGGPTGRYDAWRDEARTLAFILATT